ncbi:hypothetical protein FRX31_031383 [Thalictrum thalictroides]|uniref:Uncharacterized protein n=1 Tax=Thalictrum thalictroides TaxID=46969 RepID=A0A7J6V451_THATH|nr:hypothetical protein FRX31_031383 [Thalictrum thalictroides]
MDPYPSAIPNQLPVKSVPGQWTTGLYGCSDDPSSCFLTIFCPCITFRRIAEILDEGATCWTGNVEKGNPVRSKVPPSVPSGMAR